MAVSIRPHVFRIFPGHQIIPRLTSKQLVLTNKDTHKNCINSSSSSLFLTKFLLHRSIGSVSVVPAIDRSELTEIESETQIYVSPNISIQERGLNANSVLYSCETNKRIIMKCGDPFPQDSFISDILYSNNYPYPNNGKITNPMVSEYEKQMILLSESKKVPEVEPSENKGGKPTPEQLQHILTNLSESLSKLFVQSLDYKIYHPNLIFENNIRGTRTVGIYHYVKQVALLRIIGHLKFAYVKFEILKITSHPEDGTVKVRWRIRGISGLKIFFNFWKINILKLKESIEREQESWYDGFSTFYVDSGGLVYKLIVDKMQPESDQKLVPAETSLTAKLALVVGLMPRECPELAHIVSIIQNSRCLSETMLPLDQIE